MDLLIHEDMDLTRNEFIHIFVLDQIFVGYEDLGCGVVLKWISL